MEQETLEYRLMKLEEQNAKILDSITELKDSLPKIYVSDKLYRSEMADLERRVRDLESNSSKVTWAILGAAGSVLFTVIRAFLGV